MSGEDAPEFQNALFKRDELIHVHQSMAHISLSRHKHESEKFIRTAKGGGCIGKGCLIKDKSCWLESGIVQVSHLLQIPSMVLLMLLGQMLMLG